MKEPEYAPLPWRLERDRGAETIIAADGGVMFSDDSQDTIEGVAEYIVHCVNCHAELLAACEAMIVDWEDGKEFDTPLLRKHIRTMRAAIAKARGQE